MLRRIENTRRSNHSIFLPQNFGSPFNDTAEHLAGLRLARFDFERGAVAGEIIYSVEGDSTPISQQDEEARIATLAYALKKLGNPEDAAEHPVHTLNSQEQTRVWEVMTARKGTILFPRFYAKLCSTWGRALPVDCFIFLAAFREFLELPRLRKVLNAVRNKRRTSIRKSFLAPNPAVTTRVASAVKSGAAVKSRIDAAAGGAQ